EDLQLHVETAVGELLVGATLADVDGTLAAGAHAQPPRVCISRCGSLRRPPIWMSGLRSRTASRSSAPRSVRARQPPVISAASSSVEAPARSGPRRSVPCAAYRHRYHMPSAV